MVVYARVPAGFIRVALASVGFGFLGILAGIAYEEGADPAAVLSLRAAIVLVVVLVATATFGSLRRIASLADRNLIAMAILMALNFSTSFIAVSRMSPALVTLVLYAYPALTVIGALILGRTRPEALIFLAAASSFVGVALVVGIPQSGIDSIAVALAFASAVGYAGYLLIAEVALTKVAPLACFVAVAALSSALVLAGALAYTTPTLPTSLLGIGSLVGLGLLSAVIPGLLLTGLMHLGAVSTALITSLEILASVVGSVIFLNYSLQLSTIVGGVFVVLGAIGIPLVLSKRPLRSRGVG